MPSHRSGIAVLPRNAELRNLSPLQTAIPLKKSVRLRRMLCAVLEIRYPVRILDVRRDVRVRLLVPVWVNRGR